MKKGYKFSISRISLLIPAFLLVLLLIYLLYPSALTNPQSPEIGYYSLSPEGREGGVILPASGESYAEATYQSYYESTYQSYYQAQYESSYQGYYQAQYESSYQGYYQAQYESSYQGYYQAQYESSYQGYYQSYYQSQYESSYQGYYQSYYQSYYQGYYQASYCSANQGQVCTSPANSCGAVTHGTYQCSGACSVTTAPPEASCSAPTITLTPAPSIVINRGAACSFSWSATNATSCSVTGVGVNQTGISGSVNVDNLTQSTTYTVRCYNGSTVNTSRTVSCRVNPVFEEI